MVGCGWHPRGGSHGDVEDPARHAVTSRNFRHPVPFARELLTLDDISSGRLTVGIGAGGQDWDATVLG
jgi:alkanesulfonate monooxygenase SsuD/methylene tetrahydromethanopterin reductase-like flavin-dependent oxidoreductase (luciferase family)